MNKLPILIKREFWENRNTFVVVPMLTTGFFLLMMLFVFTASTTDFISMTIDLDEDEQHQLAQEAGYSDDVVAYVLEELDNMSELRREEHLNKGLQAMSAPLVMILWFVIFFYLLSCLYDDRRDRSILFWKSLPVSDGLTIASKLLTALLVVPLVYLVGIAVLQLSGLVLLTFGSFGTEISAWETVWAPANIFSNWFRYLAAVIFYSFWALPFFGWLLAISSFAKSVPLVWAMGLPFALTIAERIFTSQSTIGNWMGNHTIPIRFLSREHFSLSDLQYMIFSLEMLSAIVVGGGLVFLAIWLRGRADEI
ncbi:MAG: hypothetical protein HOC70_13960 [Gammaproteobacteria bacterium]|jgi:ABC-2 type transport system permease protein|nr:hypothetical protein [Gammaproteobacteria bacterium]MBT4494342.1 hypothetical protein [Gammaproteobacteria bacterium]MBT7370004.1 hypothetical protein [Gammaproteobacteria bacterium]